MQNIDLTEKSGKNSKKLENFELKGNIKLWKQGLK